MDIKINYYTTLPAHILQFWKSLKFVSIMSGRYIYGICIWDPNDYKTELTNFLVPFKAASVYVS